MQTRRQILKLRVERANKERRASPRRTGAARARRGTHRSGCGRAAGSSSSGPGAAPSTAAYSGGSTLCAGASADTTRLVSPSQRAARPRGRVLTRQRSAARARHAAVSAAHALGLSLACLDAVLLHAERPVHLHIRHTQTGELLVICRRAGLSSFKQAYLLARR